MASCSTSLQSKLHRSMFVCSKLLEHSCCHPSCRNAIDIPHRNVIGKTPSLCIYTICWREGCMILGYNSASPHFSFFPVCFVFYYHCLHLNPQLTQLRVLSKDIMANRKTQTDAEVDESRGGGVVE